MDRDPATSKRPRLSTPENIVSQCQSEFRRPTTKVADQTLDRVRASIPPMPRPESQAASTTSTSTESKAPACNGCKKNGDQLNEIIKRYEHLRMRFENKRDDYKKKEAECELLHNEIRRLKGEEVAEKPETSSVPSTPHSQASEPSTPMCSTPTSLNKFTRRPSNDVDEKKELTELHKKVRFMNDQLHEANCELELQAKKIKDLEAQHEHDHAEVRRLFGLMGTQTKEITQLKASESKMKAQYQETAEKLEYDTAKWKLSKKKLEEANEQKDSELNTLRVQFDQLTETANRTNEELIQHQTECSQLRNSLEQQSAEFKKQQKLDAESAADNQLVAVSQEAHRIRSEVLLKFRAKDEECKRLSTQIEALTQELLRTKEALNNPTIQSAQITKLETSLAEAKKKLEEERQSHRIHKELYETEMRNKVQLVKKLDTALAADRIQIASLRSLAKKLEEERTQPQPNISDMRQQVQNEIAQLLAQVRERDEKIQRMTSDAALSYQTLKTSIDQQEALTDKLTAMTHERDYWKNSFQPAVRGLLEPKYSFPPSL